MDSRFSKSALPSLILGVMLLALFALAALQYRWSGQLSQAYEQRMQAALAGASQSLRAEVRGDLSTLTRSFQVSNASSIDNLHRALASKARALPPSVPPHILYSVQLGSMAIARLQPGPASFRAIPWPVNLVSLRAELLAHAEDLAAASARRRHSRPWLASAVAPALFRAVESADGSRFTAFILVELDAPRYFSHLNSRLLNASGLDSRLAVYIADDLIYDSQPLPSPPPTAAALDLLATPPGAPRLALRPASEDASWRIAAVHRPGALDAAVASIRYRNLAAGLGVCLVLCGGMAFLVYNARRAHRIAQLQTSFVAGFSHELRTPIAAVCVLAENLRDGVSADPQQVRRYGALILDQGHRLRTMIEQILAFASHREATLQLHPVSLADAVADVLREDATLLTGLSIDTAIPADLPAALADRETLKSCIANLVGNAAKYAKSGAWIGISAAALNPGQLTLTVVDKGPGIAAEDLPHVFDPFFRGGDARARLIPGAGLGLHLVRRRMASLQGRVTIQSTPGQGCAVTLHLRPIPA